MLSLRLATDAQEVLLSYRWPGNVRELEHVIARTALKALGKHPERPRILTLAAEDFDLSNEKAAPTGGTTSRFSQSSTCRTAAACARP